MSKNDSADIYHYIVQKVGSPELVHWGQELSFQRAKECVEEFLQRYDSERA
jgi:hypothetical protein